MVKEPAQGRRPNFEGSVERLAVDTVGNRQSFLIIRGALKVKNPKVLGVGGVPDRELGPE
jgi:hypothetical protein